MLVEKMALDISHEKHSFVVVVFFTSLKENRKGLRAARTRCTRWCRRETWRTPFQPSLWNEKMSQIPFYVLFYKETTYPDKKIFILGYKTSYLSTSFRNMSKIHFLRVFFLQRNYIHTCPDKKLNTWVQNIVPEYVTCCKCTYFLSFLLPRNYIPRQNLHHRVQNILTEYVIEKHLFPICFQHTWNFSNLFHSYIHTTLYLATWIFMILEPKYNAF
jgi:hypothetical protein